MSDETLVPMDDLFSTAVDHAKTKEVEKELTPPSDGYISTPPLTVAGELQDGRPVFRVYGRWTGKEKGQVISEGFGFSPTAVKEVARFGANKGQEQYDKLTRNYQALLKAFKKAVGRDANTVLEIKQYLESMAVGARGFQFETEEGEIRFSLGKFYAVVQQ